MTEYQDLRQTNALIAVGAYQSRISNFCQSSAKLKSPARVIIPEPDSFASTVFSDVNKAPRSPVLKQDEGKIMRFNSSP
ncbi:hypothetical protein [Sphingobium sp. D43FB]|uniref:hypothetical protein n=1 Tax=Sphingobium sp. D43FB TaxID=2017595 RepID=UPI00114450FC|nr:hypothetical protein [Sphingobium sp. D43FB]